MMIREGKLSDIPKLLELACVLVREMMCVVPDKDKIKTLLTASVSSNKHKLLVSIGNDGLEGAMLTASDGFNVAEKQYAQIICLYSQTPGQGQRMLNLTMDWVKHRKAIQMVCYSSPMQSGVDKLLLKNDFKSTGSMLMWRRYEHLQQNL